MLLLVAVKKGRYSLERRAETIIESKKLKSSQPEQHGNSSSNPSVQNTSHKRDLEDMKMNGEISHLYNLDQRRKKYQNVFVKFEEKYGGFIFQNQIEIQVQFLWYQLDYWHNRTSEKKCKYYCFVANNIIS